MEIFMKKHACSLAVFVLAAVFLAAVTQVTYGRDGDEVLVGDWNGDGTDTLAVRRGNVYYFSDSVDDPDAEVTQVTYGRIADQVYAGTWK